MNKKRIVVGGSHGKTTTTAMIMHAFKITGLSFDYLVGARLEGFDQSVNITDAPVIVCEGDEYPASAIEKRPKFHFLFPHIAILTGIAWDHINVFPTFENYLDQFKIFISKIETAGQLIYNQDDEVLNNLIKETKRTDISYLPYGVPPHSIENGETSVIVEGAEGNLKVFGNHNLLNLHAAWMVCKQFQISSHQFVDAISSFTGASKRLELLAKNEHTIIYRDFAHAPSKVKATIEAVKQQLPHRKLIALLELHTYSSLNEQFMQEYEGVMNNVDVAAVFYSRHALELKRVPELKKEMVQKGFQKENLQIITEKKELEDWLQMLEVKNATLLLMSSGNYDGINIEAYAKEIIKLSI
ncbi:MAG TPA: Mur ligase family protein [Chitinophagaceae bacterium]|nr:Mur ligase family protein [Chitinophagaceae bacterium]